MVALEWVTLALLTQVLVAVALGLEALDLVAKQVAAARPDLVVGDLVPVVVLREV